MGDPRLKQAAGVMSTRERAFTKRWAAAGKKLATPERIAKVMDVMRDLLWLREHDAESFAAAMKLLALLEAKR